MPAILSLRDLGSDADNVRNTFSSWDSCMSEAYCKWPAIIGIVIGSLIVISIIWCCARCLCCGAECCCGCLSCFNRCCPSPRGKNSGYQQPQQYPPHNQYQSPAPPMYYGGGYRSAQTATFDAPTGKYNEDSLPAMPSWNTAPSRRVEEEREALEMEKLDQHSPQQQSLLHARNDSGDIGAMHPDPYDDYSQQHVADAGYGQANPYYDYSQHQQYAASLSSTAPASVYPPTYHTRPASSVYDPQSANPYAAPPSYRTGPPTIASPTPQHARMPSSGSYAMGRKPVSGAWRDV